MKKEEIIEELGIRFEACEETLEDAAEAILKLQQQDVSEELEEAYKEGIREGYNERHKYD